MNSRRRRDRGWQKSNVVGPPGILAEELPFLSARKVSLLSRHNSAWVDDVEEGQGNQHGQRVEAVLVCFLVGNTGVEAI